jgi:chemotaxis regulatin CheY-phosphate phosphatase CheZ
MIIEELTRINEDNHDEMIATIAELTKRWQALNDAGIALHEQIKKLPNVVVNDGGNDGNTKDSPRQLADYVLRATKDLVENTGHRVTRIIEEIEAAESDLSGTPHY